MCYFLTICTQHREAVLTKSTEAGRILRTLSTLETSGDFVLHAATILPDHLHLLFTLGSRLTLGQTMAKLKNLTRDMGQRHGAGSRMVSSTGSDQTNSSRTTVSTFS